MLVLAVSSGITAVGVVVWVLFAVLCNRIAVRKGRGPVLWAVLGFFFTIFALRHR